MTWQHKGEIAVAGVGFSPIERHTDTPLAWFAQTAARAAVADCGLELTDIDGLATYPPAPFLGAQNIDGIDVITPNFFLSRGDMGPISWYAQAGEGMITAAIQDATHALVSGVCTYALVWRAMTIPRGTYGRFTGNAGAGDGQFSAPYGCVSPIQWHAFAYQRYQRRFGMRHEAMAALAVNSRRNANMNEHAYFRDRALTREEFLSARMISDPLSLYDCDVPGTACVALVLTRGDRARDLVQKPAYIAAVGSQSSPGRELIYYGLDNHMDTGGPFARMLWERSGLTPKDVRATELYDGFSPSALYWLEAAGFCGEGEAHEFIQDGRIALDGELPVNTFGGSLSQGRLHGMGHTAEAVLQVTGRAGERQLDDVDAVSVFVGSPMLRGGGLILTREP